MNRINLICTLLLFLSYPGYAKLNDGSLNTGSQTNYSINGTVGDEKGETLPGATVFITNSRYIQATDGNGAFNFTKLAPGTYELVVKMRGFNPYIQSVTIHTEPVKLSVRLMPSTTLIQTVNITARKPFITETDKKAYMNIFLENFIGDTPNSWQCTLLNPEVLHFSFNADTHLLKVSANDLLIVENRALGYKIKFLLTTFKFNTEDSTCQLADSRFFEELTGTADQQKKWEAARRLAYLSSSRHFFRAVMNGTAKAEGYVVANFIEDTQYGHTKTSLLSDTPLNIDSLFFNYDQHTKAFRFDTASVYYKDRNQLKQSKKGLYIAYNGVKASPAYKTYNSFRFKVSAYMKDPQESTLYLLTDMMMIDRNGSLSFPDKVIFNGYWGWQRIADLTPLDYFVEQR